MTWSLFFLVWATCAFALAVFYVAIITLYLHGWKQMPDWTLPPDYQPVTIISVLIPARNEAENIGECLASIARQSYPANRFEVIVLDDHSTDETAAMVAHFQAPGMPAIRLVRLADYVQPHETQSFKKKAIEIGVQKATGELIVTTDADCIVQADWLALLASLYEMKKAIFIAAPVNFRRERNTFERFQSLDFLGMMCGTGAGIHLRLKNMCNGANLAYPKSAFTAVGGFEGIDHLATGDDILLMQKINARFPGRSFFLKNQAATVFTVAKPTVSSFVSQRVRWASKSRSYKEWQVTFILGMVFLYCVAIVLTLFMIPFQGNSAGWLFIGLISVKTLADWFFLGTMARFFKREDLMHSFLPAQSLHIIYIVTVGILGNLVRRYEWKGRVVK